MTTLFVSHSSHDNAVTLAVHGWLVQQGYGPVFVDVVRDDDGLIGGADWWPQLAENVKRAKIFLILASQAWLRSPYCQQESTIARLEGKQTIVLALEDCPLDDYLRRLQWVDFKARTGEAWQALQRALQRAGADPSVFRPDSGRPPFPGLAAFEAADAALYFGRETEIVDIRERLGRLRLGEKRLFVIAGPSGSGKSSLLRAGLLSRLRRAASEWLAVAPFRPGLGGDSGLLLPLEETCRQLSPQRRVERAALRRLIDPATANPADFSAFLRELAGQPSAVPLLSIDQGEELISAESKRGDAQALSRLLAGLLAPGSPVLGLMVIRSDTLGALQQHPLIGPLIVDDIYSLAPMPRERYALLIEGPIAQFARHVQAGASVEPALRDALIESADGADALPLVAFALGTLWQEHGRRDGRLRLAHLEALGGVGAAVTDAAEQLIREATPGPDGCDLEALQRAFVPGLAGVTPQGAVVRRALPLQALPPAVRPLLERFVNARLLVRSEGRGGEPHLEIAHEALLRQWPRLVGWIAQDFDSLRMIEELGRAAAAWQQAGRNPELLVHRGELLARSAQLTGLDLHERRFAAAERALIADYLTACAALQREGRAKQLSFEITLASALFERAQRAADQCRFLHAAALLGASLEANPYARAPGEVRETCAAPDVARARTLALRARSDLHSQQGQRLFGFDRRIERRIGLGSRLIFHADGTRLSLLDGRDSVDLLLASGDVRPWPPIEGEPVLDYLPERDLLLGGNAKHCSLRRRSSGELLKRLALPLQDKNDGLSEGRLLGNGDAALLSGLSRCLKVDFARGEVQDLMPAMTGKSSPLLYAMSSVVGDTVAVAGSDHVYVLNSRGIGGGIDTHATDQHYAVEAVEGFDAGNRLVFGGVNLDIRVLDLATDTLSVLGAHRDAVSSLAVLEADGLVASAGWDGRALLWSLSDSRCVLELPTEGGMLRGVVASPDGSRLAVWGDDGLSLWRKCEAPAITELVHGSTLTGVVYDPGAPGRLMSVSSSSNTCAAIWSAAGGPFARLDLPLRESLRGLAVAPAGELFAVCGDTAQVRVYSASGRLLRSFTSEGDFEPQGEPGRLAGRRGGAGRSAPAEADRGPSFVTSVSVSHDARLIGWVAPTGRLCFGDMASGEVEIAPAPGLQFSTLAFSPVADAFVAVAGSKVFRVDAGKPPVLLLDDASSESTFGRGVPLAFTRDGQRLAVATAGSTITIVPIANPGTSIRLEGHTETFKRGWKEAVGALAFDARGELLISAGSRHSGGDDPRTLRFWDAATGDPLMRLLTNSDCLALSVDPFSDTVCLGTQDRLRLLPFDRLLLSKDTAAIRQATDLIFGTSYEESL